MVITKLDFKSNKKKNYIPISIYLVVQIDGKMQLGYQILKL